jgi:hypothetical protein
MRTQTDRNDAGEAIPGTEEADVAFDAWTLEELDDDLDCLRRDIDHGLAGSFT